MKRNGKLLAAFFSGMLCGAAAGLLYAPDRGFRTRAKMMKRIKKFAGFKSGDEFDIPYMTTLSRVLNVLISRGYKENFMVRDGKLAWINCSRTFSPDEVKINNFYRFEGESDPDDMSILYAIETNTGVRGTLVDAYGIYADPDVGEFIKKVELDHNIKKKAVNSL